MLTQALLRQRYNYNSKTGLLSKKFRYLSDCPNKASQTQWNNSLDKPIGRLSTEGYLVTNVAGKTYQVHNLIWLLVTGGLPKYTIDHIDGVRTDNRWCKLRDTPDNSKNRAMQSNNTSGTTGVNECNYSGEWKVSITINGEQIYLGKCITKEEAVQVRKAAEIEYGYHKNHGRHPNEV